MKNIIIGLVAIAVLAGVSWFFIGLSSNKNMAPMKDHGQMLDSRHEAVKAGNNIVKCPVMGTEFPASRAYGVTEYKGQTYYFCCVDCPDKFEKNPEKYVESSPNSLGGH